MGENLLSEWRQDSHCHDLRETLLLIRSDSAAGYSELEKLVERGSPLAMMYLGLYYLFGKWGVEKDEVRATKLLRQSSESGSIDGSYRLATLLETQGKHSEAFGILEALADRDFSPAQCRLGQHYCSGRYIPKDEQKGIALLKKAEQGGHLIARQTLANILLRSDKRFGSKVQGYFKRLQSGLPYLVIKSRNPESDRIRG